MATLREVMPHEFWNSPDRSTKFNDVEVVRRHDPCGLEPNESHKPWPGPHKNVIFWVELANGYAVGWNENTSRGWSFPMLKLKKETT